MVSERAPSEVGRFLALLAGLLVAAAVVPTAALAADDDSSADSRDPLTYLPADSRFAARVDVEQLRESKYFKKAFEYVQQRSERADAELAQFLAGKKGFDVRSDLRTIAVGLPVSRVDASDQVERGTFVLDGDFDEEEIRSVADEQSEQMTVRQHAGFDLYRIDDTEFALPTSDRLVVTMGPKSYRNAVWSLAAEGGTSFEQTAAKHDLLDGLDTSRTVWMVNRLEGATDRPRSQVDSAGISLTIASGVDLQVVTRTGAEADAQGIVQQVEAMKQSGADNAMLAMFGAGPLVENLEVDRDGTTVVATTSMTEAQLDVLVDKIRQVAASQSRMSIPSSAPSDESNSDDAPASPETETDATKN